MRHVRMLGVSLIALFAIGAMAAVPALALKNPTTSFTVLKNCPVKAFGLNGQPVTLCNVGATELGAKGTSPGGHFTVGGITVPIERQILLQFGGANLNGLNEYEAVMPTNGFEFITPTPENVPGEPFGHITPAEQEELGWPETLKRSYSEAQKRGLVKNATETIETAGAPRVELARLIFEEETGVEVKVKIKAGNAWLSALGDVCYVGSDAEPIVQELTTGAIESPLTHETLHGAAGEIKAVDRKHEGKEYEMDILFHNVLVDNNYPVPGATCTGPNAGVIAATIDKKFGLPASAGASVTEIKGTLYAANAEAAEFGGA